MKQPSFSKSVIASILFLVICSLALIGTTFAWFTDSAESKNNIIKTGTLDIELYYQLEGQSTWTKVTSNTNMFEENARWEPGHTELVRLKIVNEGDLALKYQIGINVAEETGSKNSMGEDFKLSDFIRFGILEGERSFATREEAVSVVDPNSTPVSQVYSSQMMTLYPEEEANNEDSEDIVTLLVYMPYSVGNEANHEAGEVVPNISIGVNILAVQYSVYNDN